MEGTVSILDKATTSSIAAGDKVFVNQDDALKQIDYDQLATAILNKLSTQSFSSLGTSAKNVIGALNELNSNCLALNFSYPDESADCHGFRLRKSGLIIVFFILGIQTHVDSFTVVASAPVPKNGAFYFNDTEKKSNFQINHAGILQNAQPLDVGKYICYTMYVAKE